MMFYTIVYSPLTRGCLSSLKIQEANFINIHKKLTRQNIFTLTSALIILFGIILRTRQYITNRSLWFDELLIALNIVNRSFLQLTQPLDYGQGAPIGFLLLQKFMTQLLGNTEYSLRLLPFLAGIMALFLMYYVGKIYIGLPGMLFALGFFAVSSRPIYYASEVKQYSIDAFVSLLLLFVAHKCLEPDSKIKHFSLLCITGVLALCISHPSLFVITAISLVLGIALLLKRDKTKMLWLVGVWLVWSISFSLLYFFFLRRLSAHSGLINYWQDTFMPMPPWLNLAWFIDAFSRMLGDFGFVNILIGGIFFVLGCLSLFYRRWQLALFLILPFLITLVSSGFEKYPFRGRLLLFLAPFIFMLVAEGVERLRLILVKVNPWLAFGVWFILVTFFIYKSFYTSVENFYTPPLREHSRPVMAHLSQNKQDTDTIYIYHAAMPILRYYGPQYSLSEVEYFEGIRSHLEPEKYLEQLNTLNFDGRVWFLFSHVCRNKELCLVDEEAYFIEYLDKKGTQLYKFQSSETSLYLYNLSNVKP